MKRAISLATVVLLSALLHAPSSHSAPICASADSDSDNDGWGWENYRSCMVQASSTPVTTQAVTSQSSRYPVCANRASDSDGDGWGWESNRSCRVTSDTSVINTGVICARADSDSDGDGWGYENNRSCIVTVQTQSGSAAPPVAAATAGVDPSVQNGLYLGRYPICSSSATDDNNDGWGFENYQSCKVIAGQQQPSQQGGTSQEALKAGEFYKQNFSSANLGLYQADQLNADWETPLWHLGFDQGRVKIVNTGGTNGRAMEVTYPAGRYGASGASAFLSDVQFGMGLPKSYNELYVAYDIRFAPGFNFVKGGKLPGLCGSDTNQAPSTGCNTGGGVPSGYDGWSARGMWRENGAMENYIYHSSQSDYFGDHELWNVRARRGVWHRVQHRVVLNTPGRRNGILEAWFDGVKVLSLNNLEYRKSSSIGINMFYFSTFFGGNDASWAPSSDQTMNFDNFVISTSKIN